MNKIKLTFKVLITALLPHIFQFIAAFPVAIIAGIIVGIESAGGDLNGTEVAEQISVKIMGLTTSIVMLGSIFVIVLLYIVHESRKRHKMTVAYRFNKMSNSQILKVSAIGFVGFIFAVAFSTLLDVASFDPEAAETLDNLVTGGSFILTFLSVGIIAPICEEIIFRGSIMKNLTENMNIKVAIVLQAILFSLYHMNPVQALPTFVLGMTTGLAVYFTNSIWGGIIIHVINNGLAIILSNLPTSGAAEVEAVQEVPVLGFSIAALIAGCIIVFLLYRLSKDRTEWTELEPIEAKIDLYVEDDEDAIMENQ